MIVSIHSTRVCKKILATYFFERWYLCISTYFILKLKHSSKSPTLPVLHKIFLELISNTSSSVDCWYYSFPPDIKGIYGGIHHLKLEFLCFPYFYLEAWRSFELSVLTFFPLDNSCNYFRCFYFSWFLTVIIVPASTRKFGCASNCDK